MKSKDTGCGSISTVFSSIVLLCGSSIIIIIIIIIMMMMMMMIKIIMVMVITCGKYEIVQPYILDCYNIQTDHITQYQRPDNAQY